MNSKTISLSPPLSDEVILTLHAGDRVLLSGVVYTARDAAHQKLVAAIEANEPLPLPLEGQVIYYVGPSPARPGAIIGSAGPTTAGRMDGLTPPLLERGLKGMIGKGRRNQTIRLLLREGPAVYFVTVGGAAALIAKRIKTVEMVAYPELGTEAIRRLEVEDFPLLVANDAHGGDLFAAGQAAYRRQELPV